MAEVTGAVVPNPGRELLDQARITRTIRLDVDIYEDALYSGLIGYYTDCGDGDTELTVIVAAPPDDEFVVLVGVTSVTDADDEAYVRILDTFQVVGDVPN